MKHFKPEEFACKCGCGLNNMHPRALFMLDRARGQADVPFVITSGSRCPAHNKAEGGSPTSSHLAGYAVDLRCSDSVSRQKIVKALLDVGFRRVGISDRFIHVDIDPNKVASIWLY